MKLWAIFLLLLIGVCSCARFSKTANTPDSVVVKALKRSLPEAEKKRNEYLARKYFKEEGKFDSYTTDNWTNNFASFATVLVQKAQDQKLDSVSLRKVLDLILERSAGKTAFLPISAYQNTLNGSLVWIVVIKWEYPSWSSLHDGQPVPLSHIRVYGFDQKTLKNVGFASCL
jgi:hypothetical protein